MVDACSEGESWGFERVVDRQREIDCESVALAPESYQSAFESSDAWQHDRKVLNLTKKLCFQSGLTS